MNAEEIDTLINQIENIQINLNNTHQQLNIIRARAVINNAEILQQPVPEEEDNTERSLRVGDRVEILNPVRLRGSIRSSRNVQGTVQRFTQGDYVIVRENLRRNRNSSVDSYQEIRRARHNVGRIIEDTNSQ